MTPDELTLFEWRVARIRRLVASGEFDRAAERAEAFEAVALLCEALDRLEKPADAN